MAAYSGVLPLLFVILQIIWLSSSCLGQADPDLLDPKEMDVILEFQKTMKLPEEYAFNATSVEWRGIPTCDWGGLTCSSRGQYAYRHIIQFIIDCTELNSSEIRMISPALGNLTYLQSFVVLKCNMTGNTIPNVFGDLNGFNTLIVSNTGVGGAIPDSIPSPFKVVLNVNELTGTIPPSFFANTSTLNYLNLQGNRLEGSFPQNIGAPLLKELTVNGNAMNGSLPSLPPLVISVDYSHNNFSGLVPKTPFGQLMFCDISNNDVLTCQQQSACCPDYPGCDSNIESISLATSCSNGTWIVTGPSSNNGSLVITAKDKVIIQGSYFQFPNATLEVFSNPGVQLQVFGDTSLGGTLIVHVYPNSSSTLIILNATSITGTFDNVKVEFEYEPSECEQGTPQYTATQVILLLSTRCSSNKNKNTIIIASAVSGGGAIIIVVVVVIVLFTLQRRGKLSVLFWSKRTSHGKDMMLVKE